MQPIPEERKKSYDELAVENFRTYLRIPSVHPNVDYGDCVKFLKAQAKTLDLPCLVVYVRSNKPVVIITWKGTDAALPSIILNSHMDVVPVFEEKWTHKPFAADIDEQGRIYARGSQDMKCVGIQYLESIRRMKENGVRLKRTLHCTFVPDEEIGGALGMKEFVKTAEFKAMNVGFALDEGMASVDESFVVFYGEKCMWNLKFYCPGTPGHGSQLGDNTAAQKLRRLLDRIDDFRNSQMEILKNDPTKTLSDVTAINATIFNGGVQCNVLPDEICVTMDCRMPVTMDLPKWEETLNRWCRESGEGVRVEKLYHEDIVEPTKLDDSNPFWVAFKNATDLKLQPVMCSAITDNRFMRRLGIPALGFSPMSKCPVLFHANDEYLSKNIFLEGINIYCKDLKLLPIICYGVTDNRYLRSLGIAALGFSPMSKCPLLLHANDEYLSKDIFLGGIDIYCKLISAVANV